MYSQLPCFLILPGFHSSVRLVQDNKLIYFLTQDFVRLPLWSTEESLIHFNLEYALKRSKCLFDLTIQIQSEAEFAR